MEESADTVLHCQYNSYVRMAALYITLIISSFPKEYSELILININIQVSIQLGINL